MKHLLLVIVAALLAVSFGAKSFAGSNLYYAAGLYPNDQHKLLSNLQLAGVKVLRVWLDGQGGQPKGTPIQSYPSLEPNQIGQYDDTVLDRYDDFMLVAQQYKIKLMISMHSFNALQAGDVYGRKYGTGYFYEDQTAQNEFDNRLRHVLTHTHKTLGKQWKDLHEYIFAFEAENEAMIGKGQDYIASHQYWQCDRANTIKSVLGSNSGILVTTGGESWLDESMQPDWFHCDSLDILAIHDYGEFNTQKFQMYVQKAVNSGKKLIVQEWGACYYTTDPGSCLHGNPMNQGQRANNIKNYANSMSQAGIPWMYWQIIPNADPHQDYDFEIGIDSQNWWDFVAAANSTKNYDSPFDFSPYLIY